MKIKSYKIVTFGCQMNLADSGTLAAMLSDNGFHPAETEEEADLIILNTCSVRQKAEERVFGRLGELSRLKRMDSAKRIAVIGCMAQRLGPRILDRAPFVDIILGTDRIFDLPDILSTDGEIPQIHTEFGHGKFDGITPASAEKYSAFVTVSRGCDNYCTYCIVPYVRGHLRSYRAGEIISQINRLTREGVVEVMLLGQNVNSYRDNDIDFPHLLRHVAAETDVKRLRFMTSHPKDLSDSLIEVMATEPKMMPHLHLPLQSGSDKILSKMGRDYTIEHYLKLVNKLKSAVPDISLTTDLIVGFPSETEVDYRMTLEAVNKVKFDSAFMFRYSVREGTAAARWLDDVSEEEKIRRLKRLIELQKKVSFDRNQLEIGKIRSVLADGYSKRSKNYIKGKTGGSKTVLFEGNADIIGKINNVKIIAADSWTLHGELVA